MACKVIRGIAPDGSVFSGIACGPRQKIALCDVEHCGREHSALCDWPVERTAKHRSDTCDMKLCDKHRVRLKERDRDYCPEHYQRSLRGERNA